MAKTKITADELTESINQVLKDYQSGVIAQIKSIFKKETASALRKLKQISSEKFKGTGEYAKSWTRSKDADDATHISYTLHAKKPKYRQTHLLEHGHLKFTGTQTVVRNGKAYKRTYTTGGRVAGVAHISVVEQELENTIMSRLKKELKE